jgi:hypothetical protein
MIHAAETLLASASARTRVWTTSGKLTEILADFLSGAAAIANR